MKKILTRAITASTLFALAGAARADIVYLDFENAADGETITDQYAGLTFGLVGADEGPKAHLITKKKLQNKYGDAGGMTIRPSNSNKGTFKGPWYDIEIGFETPTDFFSIRALDADEPVSAFAYLGETLVDSISFKGGKNFQVRMLELGEIGGSLFDRVVLDIREKGGGKKPGPEIFDNLSFNNRASMLDPFPDPDPDPDPLPPVVPETPRVDMEVPTPGAVALLAPGGVFALRRKRRAA